MDAKFAEDMSDGKLQSEKWVLFPTYMGLEVVRMGVGRIQQGYGKEWVLAAQWSGRGKSIGSIPKKSGGMVRIQTQSSLVGFAG